MIVTRYCIAGHILELSVQPGTKIDTLLPSFAVFAVPPGDERDVLFALEFVDQLPDSRHTDEVISFEWEDAQCTIHAMPEGFEISLVPHGTGITYRMLTDSHFGNARALLHNLPGTDTFAANNFLMMLYAFATARHNTLMFHASVIIKDGLAYLFLGKSGTGKSTHSRLWLENIPGSELLNDDNPIVRWYPDGRAVVYGSPWSGKTPCYRNEEASVKAIVRLKQAPVNHIIRQRVPQAFASLLGSCSCFRKHQGQFDGVCDSVGNLAPQVPCYLLECLPDARAAELCFSTVSRL